MTRLDWMRLCSGALFAGVIMFATGCQIGVERDSPVTSKDQVLPFAGFTQVSGSTVEIEVFNKATRRWQWIGNTTANTSGINAKDAQDKPIKLFYWRFDFKLSDQFSLGNTNWRCFVHELCVVQDPEEKIQFRFHTADGIQFAYNFGQGGVSCAVDEWSAGVNIVTTYNDCKNVSDADAAEFPLGVTYVTKPEGIGWEEFEYPYDWP